MYKCQIILNIAHAYKLVQVKYNSYNYLKDK